MIHDDSGRRVKASGDERNHGIWLSSQLGYSFIVDLFIGHVATWFNYVPLWESQSISVGEKFSWGWQDRQCQPYCVSKPVCSKSKQGEPAPGFTLYYTTKKRNVTLKF